jgi:hypothetical protein
LRFLLYAAWHPLDSGIATTLTGRECRISLVGY